MTYFESIISKAKWWSIGTELHYGEEIPTEVEMDARRRDVSVHTGTNLSVLSDEDLVTLYDLAPDYGWLYDDAYDNGTSLADAIFQSADMTADDDLDAAVDVLRERIMGIDTTEKKYTVLPEYRDLWSSDPDWDGTVDEKEIKRLASEWGKTVNELMGQVEEV